MRDWYLVLLVAALIAPLRLLEARFCRRVAAAAVLAAAALAAGGLAAGAGVVWPVVVALLFNAAAAGYGRWLAPRLHLGGGELLAWHEVPLRLALGWGGLICAGLLAGSVGALTSAVVAGVGAVGVALAAWPTPVASASLPLPPHGLGRAADGGLPVAWWWGLAVLLLVGFVEAVAPEARHDALAAHLPIAREFALRHAIVEVGENAASYFQLNADLLYAMAMLVAPGTALPKLLHYGAGAAASLLGFDLGARMFGPRAGLVAAAGVAGTPLLWWLGGTAYTDLWGMLFAVGALHAAYCYGRRPDPGRAIGVGLLAGAAVGTKIPAAVVILPLVMVLLAWIARDARGTARWLSVAGLAGGFAAAGAYWYARAWVLLGNPVYPLFRSVFNATPRSALPLRLHGMGDGLADLLALPWRVTWHPERFVEVGPIGIVYLLLLPVALLAVAQGRVPRWVAGVFVAAGLLWFWTSQYLRFFVPALPLAALMGAGGIAALRGRAQAVGAALVVMGLAVNAASWTDLGGWQGALRVALRRTSRAGYLATHVPGYRVAEYAARALPPDARIVGAGEELGFYYERFFVPISWRGRRYDRSLRLELLSRSGAEVAAKLRARGFTHLVVVPDALPFARRRGAWAAREAFWEEGPRLLFADGRHYLLENTAAGPTVPGVLLLDIGGASPEISRTVVGLTPGALYALEAEVRSTAPGGAAAMTIRWLDGAGGSPAGTPVRRMDVSQDWRRVAMAAAAPEGTFAASVRVERGGPDPVEIRRMRFYDLR